MLEDEPCNPVELEQLIRKACGLPPHAAKRGARREKASMAGNGDAKAAQLTRLSIDLLLATRQSGLSPTESGCFFLLLAAHLLNDIPPKTIAAMIEHIERQPRETQS